jgi:hypothetical protein
MATPQDDRPDDRAESILLQDLTVRRSNQDVRGEGAILSQLGQLTLARNDLDAATTAFQQSLPLLRETRDSQGEGAVLSGLALIAESRDDLAAAERFHHESLQRNSEAQEAGTSRPHSKSSVRFSSPTSEDTRVKAVNCWRWPQPAGAIWGEPTMRAVRVKRR